MASVMASNTYNLWLIIYIAFNRSHISSDGMDSNQHEQAISGEKLIILWLALLPLIIICQWLTISISLHVITLEAIIILRAFGDSISLTLPKLPVYVTVLYRGGLVESLLQQYRPYM